MSRQPQSRHYLISGRVQGVFYRASAEAQARRLGLCGWVRNLADGRVEAVASGTEQQLERFEAWLRRGPPLARVDAVAIADWAAPVDAAGFTTRRDGTP